jgi:hypothetical protein
MSRPGHGSLFRHWGESVCSVQGRGGVGGPQSRRSNIDFGQGRFEVPTRLNFHGCGVPSYHSCFGPIGKLEFEFSYTLP